MFHNNNNNNNNNNNYYYYYYYYALDDTKSNLSAFVMKMFHSLSKYLPVR